MDSANASIAHLIGWRPLSGSHGLSRAITHQQNRPKHTTRAGRKTLLVPGRISTPGISVSSPIVTHSSVVASKRPTRRRVR